MTFQHREPKPWEDPELAWWSDYKRVCKNKERFDDRICDHPENKFASCMPSNCPILCSTLVAAHQPPPLPADSKPPRYYKVRVRSLIQEKIPMTTHEEYGATHSLETTLELLLPDELEEGIEIQKMEVNGVR
jgi:hypothetical protein